MGYTPQFQKDAYGSQSSKKETSMFVQRRARDGSGGRHIVGWVELVMLPPLQKEEIRTMF